MLDPYFRMKKLILIFLLLFGCAKHPTLIIRHNNTIRIPVVAGHEEPEPGKFSVGGIWTTGEQEEDSTEYYYQEHLYKDYYPYLQPMSRWYIRYGLNKHFSIVSGYDEKGYSGDIVFHIRENPPYSSIVVGALFINGNIREEDIYPRVSISFSASPIKEYENIKVFGCGTFTYFPVYIDFSLYFRDTLGNEHYYEIDEIYRGSAMVSTIGVDCNLNHFGFSLGYDFIGNIKAYGVRVEAEEHPPDVISVNPAFKTRFRGGIYFKF